MKQYYKFNCFEEARLAGHDILEGNGCNGKQCPKYATCQANKEFEALPKYGVTDYEIEAAIERERYYGVENFE